MILRVTRIPRVNALRLGLAARRDWFEAMELLATTAPGVAKVRGLPVVVVQDPEAAREILVADTASYGRPWLVRNTMEAALGHNLFTSEGDEWLTRRQPIAPVFAARELDGLAAVMAATLADEIERWQPGRASDVQADLTRLTMRVACRALLGTDPRTDEIGAAIDGHFQQLLDWIAHRFTHMAAPPPGIPTRKNRALRRARVELRGAMLGLIETRRRHSDVDAVDVISQLVRAQDAGASLSDDDIVNECIGFLFAGHETTAATLTWGLYELARHPDVQLDVAREGQVLDLDPSGLFRRVDALETVGRVVDETLRLYPAGIGIAQSARRTTTVAGCRVRRGSIVLVAVLAMQRNPNHWDQPAQFDPTRDFSTDVSDGSPGPYLPFGLGPRRCLGARFARTEFATCPRTRVFSMELSIQRTC